MTPNSPADSRGGSIKPGSRDDPHVYDTSDPYVEDKAGRARRLIELMPLSFRRLIEELRERIAEQARTAGWFSNPRRIAFG